MEVEILSADLGCIIEKALLWEGFVLRHDIIV